jgi:hypothetical protein
MSYEYKAGDEGVTRDGKKTYRVIGKLANGDGFLAVATRNVGAKDEWLSSRQLDGRFTEGRESVHDLMPPTRVVWVNFYANQSAWHYPDEKQAQHGAGSQAIAVAVRVELKQ